MSPLGLPGRRRFLLLMIVVCVDVEVASHSVDTLGFGGNDTYDSSDMRDNNAHSFASSSAYDRSDIGGRGIITLVLPCCLICLVSVVLTALGKSCFKEIAVVFDLMMLRCRVPLHTHFVYDTKAKLIMYTGILFATRHVLTIVALYMMS